MNDFEWAFEFEPRKNIKNSDKYSRFFRFNLIGLIMAKKLLIEKYKQKLFEICGNIVILDESTYIDSSTKCRFIDKDFPNDEWWAFIHNVLKGHCHPKRANENRKQTCKNKYGCEYTTQSEQVKQKIKQTNLERLGVESALQSEQVKQKIKQTNLKRRGVEYPMQSEEVREKSRQTCEKKYGYKYPMQSKEIQEKTKQTCQEVYGCNFTFQNKEIRKKIKQTMLNRHGVENASQSEDIKQKKRETFIKNFGVENVFCLEKTKEKIKETNLKNHGCEYAMQSEQVREKSRQTCQAKYGCDYPSQNPDIALKVAKSQKNSGSAIHWKTGKEVVWTASYEKFFIEALNISKIDFEKDIPFYNEKDNYVYFVDFYLPEYDIYIELKGREYEKGMKKFAWFHEEYPNSVMWKKKDLKELGILKPKPRGKK